MRGTKPLFLALTVILVCGLALAFGAQLLGMTPGTAELARGGVALTLLRALMFNAFLFFVLRSFDLMAGFSVKGFLRDAKRNNNYRAAATYLGARVLAVAIGNGLIFS